MTRPSCWLPLLALLLCPICHRQGEASNWSIPKDDPRNYTWGGLTCLLTEPVCERCASGSHEQVWNRIKEVYLQRLQLLPKHP